MKKLLFLLCLSFISCNNLSSQAEEKDENGVTTFYFIRHAEKQTGSDPALTVKGERRANEWINYFFLKDVDAILSSDTNRTRSTAAPLSRAKKIETTIYDVATVNGKSLLDEYRGKTVVLYGHSNTVNKYANDLQKDTNYPELDDADFDHFFIVKIDANGNTNAVKEAMEFELD